MRYPPSKNNIFKGLRRIFWGICQAFFSKLNDIDIEQRRPLCPRGKDDL